QQLAYIFHRGDTKDPGPDQFLDLAQHGYEVWQFAGADPANPYAYPIRATTSVGGGDLRKARAHWVSEDTLAWQLAADEITNVALYYSPD
ncbi:MAG: hypothetical protein KDE54_37870, partial [Caldilineaceae bacterium]|nr:hypothetical protein [Caldilineaceae bacterium]